MSEVLALALLPSLSVHMQDAPTATPMTEQEAAPHLGEPGSSWTRVYELAGDEGRPSGTVEVGRELGIENHWIDGGWVVHEMRGQSVKVGHAGEALPAVSSGGCGWSGPSSVGVLRSPARFVYRCSLPIEGEIAFHSALWTPDGVHTWVQRPPTRTMVDSGALEHPVLPETGGVDDPKPFGELPAMVDEFAVFIDLVGARRWSTPVPVDPIHMSIRGIPTTGLLKGVDDAVVYQVDFSGGTLQPLDDFPTCDGALVERRRQGSRLLLHCLHQPTPGMWRFDVVWGAVYDLETHQFWALEATPEAFTESGVIVSERAESAAESTTQRGGLSHVALP